MIESFVLTPFLWSCKFLRNAELANGRLAMMAIIGMFFQDGLTGSAWGDWANYTESPLRAFENELGVQAPVGFWDPAGFTSDGDAREFYRRRVVEIKHGRVSMLACTGYIVQEFVRFPGFLSPSSDIKFADVPNGLKAVTVVPAVGWFQYTVFCGLCDLWIADQRPTNPPGKLQTRLFGDEALNYDYGFLGIPAYLGGKPVEDPELKKKKLPQPQHILRILRSSILDTCMLARLENRNSDAGSRSSG